jgi:hypothetical protein
MVWGGRSPAALDFLRPEKSNVAGEVYTVLVPSGADRARTSQADLGSRFKPDDFGANIQIARIDKGRVLS